jgi:hypothetical protein
MYDSEGMPTKEHRQKANDRAYAAYAMYLHRGEISELGEALGDRLQASTKKEWFDAIVARNLRWLRAMDSEFKASNRLDPTLSVKE